MRKSILPGLVVLALGLCTSGAAMAAGAISETNHYSYPNSFVLPNPCTGNPIAFTSGTFEAVVHVTITPDGRIHVVSSGHPQGAVGTDLVTGDTFHYVGGVAEQQNLDGSGVPLEFTSMHSGNFVGQGPGNNLIQHVILHTTINANGEVTSTVDHVSIECR